MLRMVLLGAVISLGTAAPVKILTAGSFEKETQAATGQTAGPWCVSFSEYGHTAHNEAWGRVAYTQQTEGDRSIQFGRVDVTGNTPLATRFNVDVKYQPAVFLFRNGMMYRLRQGRLEDDAALTKFCTAVEPSEPAQAVTMDNNIESFSELLTFLRTTRAGWSLMAGILLIPLSILLVPAAVIYKILNSESHPGNIRQARVMKAE